MREILFKAKRKDNGKWVKGFYQNRYEVNEEIEHLIFCRKGYNVWEYAEIDPETLCQYTGMNDKNGNRIWENDIVKHEVSDTIGTVRWYQGDYIGWCVDDVVIYEQQFTDEMWDECEVIRNIFDNPEMLEGE